MTTELNQEIKPLTLDTLKQLKAALDARVSIDGTTKEQRELLERFAGVDLLATAIGIADGAFARLEGAKVGLKIEIASKKQAEAERDREKRDADRLGAEVHVLKSERDTYAEQLAGTLAVLSEQREALKTVKAKLPLDGTRRNAELLVLVTETLASATKGGQA